MVTYLNIVEPVQPTPVCRVIDVIAGNDFARNLADCPKLALLGAELKLCNWGIYFYPDPGSALALNTAASYADNGSTVINHQHIWLCSTAVSILLTSLVQNQAVKRWVVGVDFSAVGSD